jgi:hypothetical protein
MPARFA